MQRLSNPSEIDQDPKVEYLVETTDGFTGTMDGKTFHTLVSASPTAEWSYEKV